MKNFLENLFKTIIPKLKKEPSELSKMTSAGVKPLKKDKYIPSRIRAYSGRSVGMVRDHNEDSLFNMTSIISSNNIETTFGIYVVADGMGGHQHGEIASEIAIHTLTDNVVRNLYLPMLDLNHSPPDESFKDVMLNGVKYAQKTIIQQVPGGGTTLTALLILGNIITIAHVGDSRVYLIDDDIGIKSLTQDHSLVSRLIELGQITSEEAEDHPQRNVLYRALGQGEPIDPDIITMTMPERGCLLLCTDGLWGAIEDESIFKIVTKAPNHQTACQRLVEAANSAGGPDNISVILVNLTD